MKAFCDMELELTDKLQAIYDQMCENEEARQSWENIPLAKEALQLMRENALIGDNDFMKEFCETIVEEEILSESNTPRLLLAFMDLYHILDGKDTRFGKDIDRLRQLIDPQIHEEEKLTLIQERGRLLYDPVQLTEAWEENIYEVEKELGEKYKNTKRYRGFCHEFWASKKAALARRGIRWKSPGIMNPRVKFD